jgi:hypothetical protein
MFAPKAHRTSAPENATVRTQPTAPASARPASGLLDRAQTGRGEPELDDEQQVDRIERSIIAATPWNPGAGSAVPWDLVGVPAFGSSAPAISGRTADAPLVQLQRREASESDDRDEREETEDLDDRVQTKLAISEPDDPYEREADDIAELVVDGRPTASAAPAPGAEPSSVQRACDGCQIDAVTAEEQDEDKAQDESESDDEVSPKREPGVLPPPAAAGARSLEAGLRSARVDARPLPRHVRQDMEQRFGENFGDVRIHMGHYSSAMCRAIRAKAFTHRHDVYFNVGQFSPATADGRRLLAHELTHVVQQTGSRHAPPMLQRSQVEAKIGNWAHMRIERELRERDRKLITEAPIPGATRHYKAINTVGFADFYKAEGQTVSGISAWEQAASAARQTSLSTYKYVAMRSDWLAKAQSQSDIQTGPNLYPRRRNPWDFTRNFPRNFQIGELKPLFPGDFPASYVSLGTGGSATIQTGNYREGFKEFVERVYKDNPAQQANLPPTITGRPLVINPANIPNAINYMQFEQQSGNLGPGAIVKRDKMPWQRVWMYPLANGLYVYFLVRHPYVQPGLPQAVEQQIQRLEPLLRGLRGRRDNINGQLMGKRDSSAPSPERRRRAVIQRKGEDWNVAAKDWEKARGYWVAGAGGAPKPKQLLKDQAKGPLKKAKIDKALKLRPTGKMAAQIRDIKRIKFWSSFRGRILGALRFRFGHVFDKVEEWFEKLKAKFRKHHANSDKLVTKNGVFSGWKKVATAAIIKFGVLIFKEMLASAFRRFTSCINGIINAIFGKFAWVVDEAREEIMQEVQPVCCQVMEFKEGIEEEYKKHEETIAAFTEAVETLQEWRQILDYVETAVRIGVQVISCATPPALGCLWGLVAQLGISAGLSLLARTDYFEEEIAKPAARALMATIVGDKLHNFLIELLEKTPLEPYLKEAAECQKHTSVTGSTKIGGNLEKLDPNLPANAKARADWEREFGPQILRDLQKVFEKGKGQTVSQQDLQKLLEALKNSKATPEDLKKMLEAARNPMSGKLTLEKAIGTVEAGEVPEATVVERDIDYAKATKGNAYFQRVLGWKPQTFYPKPGITADSTEFADAVYDMQGALGFKKPDGILGEQTLLAFYDKNKKKPDASYNEATRIVEERKAKKDAREREKAEKEKKKDESTTDTGDGGGGSQGQGTRSAIQIEKPDAGTRIISSDWVNSSPQWASVPFAVAEPTKDSYSAGERVTLNVFFYVKGWYVFPGFSAEVKEMTVDKGARKLVYRTRETFYFKLSVDADAAYEFKPNTWVAYLDWEGVLF